MTLDRPAALQPRWAEWLLRTLLSAEDRDCISGDLLEEYRQAIVPALGRGADAWYIRQVARYVMWKTWIWAALVGGILITRYLFDTLAPIQYTPGVVAPRSAVMSDALIATFAFGAAWQTWRSGDLRGGVLAAFVTAALGGAFAAAGTIVCLAIWHDPATLQAAQDSGGLDEALWAVPLLLIPIGLITGTAGAIAGRAAHAIAAPLR